MFVVLIHLHARPDQVDALKAICVENASQSILEPGIARFDVLQQQDDPTRFILYEAYRTPDAQAAHRETAHYKRWREIAPPLLAEDRYAVRFESAFLPDAGA